MSGTSARQRFERDGYLVLPEFRSGSQIAALRQQGARIVDAFDPAEHVGIFSTRDQARTADSWFLGSGDKVRCCFEEEAFDSNGRLRRAKALSINKIGHALHDLDAVFETFSRGEDLAELAAGLGLVDPRLWQSMLIFKQPGIGGEVRWHQDATYLYTTPMTLTAFWFALEDATVDNGCLWVDPGGHRGPLRERFVRNGDSVWLDRLDTTPWPDIGSARPLEVAAGCLVVLHGLLPHYSARNRSAISRQAYSLHAASARSDYAADNWLQRRADLSLRGFA